MQTFLTYDLKKASREKDGTKILSLGPYALCLSYILAKAKQPEKSDVKYVYRGMLITK
jgi:hypothetical protein